ncbi:lysine transporter LysE [Bordetella genomosp. 1]|uniref:Lysine transporter LysE n=1 Tax=Bordetella genomosp. 1 TaxID=1395607 RepID=A0A261SEW3_9BORD|nr:LysE family translocator [Bordetella genomosp. 1]MDQ8034889.1 LysE family translocator [Bordetella sp.]OZI35934.1 lysine transporter LysE [Bordetella genomosp. 1]OZI58602.1 lysine transporter LysE [Bordetella genomosp. 1]
MFDLGSFFGFVLICIGMVLTPGPNMVYLISRSLSQGRRAGLISLGGVALGLMFFVLCASLGITALLMAVPYAYEALCIGGAFYLMYLAWQALRPGGRSPFEVRQLAPSSPRRLFTMGLLTSLLNPKIAVLYLSLLPQFIDPARGHVLTQGLMLGFTQATISVTVNAMIVLAAGAISQFFMRSPAWMVAQRMVMGSLLGALAVRMALDSRR